MRTLLTTAAVFFILHSIAQQTPVSNDIPGEFKVNSNGFIYTQDDIDALKFIVDSLNLKFKSCSLNKNYLSYPQTTAAYIRFQSDTNNLLAIKKDIERGASLDELQNKYAVFIHSASPAVLVIKTPAKDSEKRAIVLTGNAYDGFDTDHLLTEKLAASKNGRLYEYEPKDKYISYYSVQFWEFNQPFIQQIIPVTYASMMQYVDCMIDTAASIFTGKKKLDSDYSRDDAAASKIYNDINDYLNKKMMKEKKKDDYGYEYVTNEKIAFAKNSLADDSFLKTRLRDLAAGYIKSETGNDAAEDLIAFFISKEKALQIKRQRRVFGACSMDNSPRVHAKNIASLAAETHSWDIFLRAHLNIMNDRFDRASDGSWAWGARQTYIRELEVLDINVLDLMFGLSLRSYNNADNHYNGTVWRIGKGLAESKDRLLFETRALGILKDNTLDTFNRSLVFLLYHTYLNSLTEKKEKEEKIHQLYLAADNYPGFIKEAIVKTKLKSLD